MSRRSRVSRRVVFLVLVGGVALAGCSQGDDATPSASAATASSLGTGLISVPDVEGATVVDAEGTMAEARLGFGVVEIDSDLPAAIVVAQEPPPGSDLSADEVVGVRTAVPVPPPSADCPVMGSARRIPADSLDALPAAEAVELHSVRRVADTDRDEIIDQFGASGVFVGSGVLGGWTMAGDNAIPAPPGFHLVVQLEDPASCPTVPSFFNGVPLWFTVGWPK